MKGAVILIVAALAAAAAQAKLPPPSDEAKAKSAETAARAAWTTSVGNYQLCKAQDRVAARYRAEAQASAKGVTTTTPTPPCTDPGSFAYAPAESRPLEAAGAHSPPKTASEPPSTRTPDAAGPAKKP